MKRTAYTLVELLITIAIVGILLSILFAGCKGCVSYSGYYATKNTANYQCVKTYIVTTGTNDATTTSKRVDLRNENKFVETFTCDDDFWLGVGNSATIYAQFEPGHFYQVTSVGTRKEGFYWSWFPAITNVQEIEQ